MNLHGVDRNEQFIGDLGVAEHAGQQPENTHFAVGQGFDVKVVALPAGLDPADDPSGFGSKLAAAEPYLLYRSRIEIERAEDREHAFRAVKAILDAAPDSPERHDAWRYANDRLGMTVQLRATGGSASSSGRAVSARLRDAGARLERASLAAAIAHVTLRPVLAELTVDHFDDPAHRAIRAHVAEGAPLDADSVGLYAELDAEAATAGITEETGRELLLNLRARGMRRELQTAAPARKVELEHALQRLREATTGVS